MKNIDFLPQHYRNRRIERSARVWELGIVAFFGLLISAAALWQHLEKHSIRAAEADLLPSAKRAEEARALLQQHKARLASSGEAAELYFYLHHPWPRSQVLSAVHSALPEETFLTELQLTSQSERIAAPPIDEAEQKKLSNWKRDLTKLRREADRRTALVWIVGETSNATHVYEFAAELGKVPLFRTVKLETVESHIQGSEKLTTFRLRGELRAGYGQPGGPGKPEPASPRVSQRLFSVMSGRRP